MPSVEDVRDWIAWERENLAAQAGQYPVVAEVSVTGLWERDASDDYWGDKEQRERTLGTFAAELDHDPTDVTARFVALHFYNLARSIAEAEAREDAEDSDGQVNADEEVKDVRARYRRDLGLLIGLLPIDQCPSDWRFIEWEVLNSCLAGDLDRVVRLLGRAEEKHLIDRALAQAFRGQYRFVAVMKGTSALESQYWRPRLYSGAGGPEDDRLMALVLLLLGMASRHPETAAGETHWRGLAAQHNSPPGGGSVVAPRTEKGLPANVRGGAADARKILAAVPKIAYKGSGGVCNSGGRGSLE